jgi:hypothetical protein
MAWAGIRSVDATPPLNAEFLHRLYCEAVATLLENALERLNFRSSRNGLQLGIRIRKLAMLILPIALSACAGGGDDSRSGSFFGGDKFANQPFPNNYRAELLAFLRTYLNNPVGVRDAALAEPVPRDISGKTRYVACLRYAMRESDGGYREPRERAVLFFNGRLDRMIENGAELCAGSVYAPFPEMEKLTR